MNKVPLSHFSIRDYDRFGSIRHICILRHPHGVVSSIQTREHRSEKVAMYRWSRCLEVFQSLDNDTQYDPIFISFDKLLENPEQVLKSLCDTLGVEFSKNMLSAPSKNDRYGGKTFDKSKAVSDGKDDVWRLFSVETRYLYQDIYKKCL